MQAGIQTIRAYDSTGRFADRFAAAMDRATRMALALKVCERWLGVRLELIGSTVSLVAACLVVQGVDSGTISASTAGVSVSFSMTTAFTLTSTVRTFATLEASMNSVERIHYTGVSTPQERQTDDCFFAEGQEAAQRAWPTRGEIVVEALVMRYREDSPIVLKGISFRAGPGEKLD